MGTATDYFNRRWRDGSDERYRARMKAVWEAEVHAPGNPMRYSMYFDASMAGFGEAVMAIGALPLADVRFKCDVARGRYGIAFTTDFATWQTALGALKSCPVDRLATYQNEPGRGDAGGHDGGMIA